MMHLPRVLIFGQPFNDRHGGGITLSNLFRGWDKDKLAVAATGHVMKHVTTDVCDIYYQLGNDEFRWSFPFNLIQKKYRSGLLGFGKEQTIVQGKKRSKLRYNVVNKIFYPVLEWLGLFHNSVTIRISDRFSEWLREYKPELLYLQVSSLDTILFAGELKNLLGIPSVIHMMDDWPSTISRRGPFRKLWHRKIDSELKSLFDRTDLFLSISEAMSDEYRRRYNRHFIPFHNPIDISSWRRPGKDNLKLNGGDVNVLYSGRIGPGITRSLVETARAISEINSEGLSVKFHIQSPSADPEILRSLTEYKCTVINPVADYEDLPGIYSAADILVIANDFDEKGLSFLRYSMPTKASEYMISGTPVLVYSHHDTAVSRFFSRHQCGCCVTEHDTGKLIQALKLLISDEDYRTSLSRNAVRVATELFDGEKKREEYRQLLIKTSQLYDR